MTSDDHYVVGHHTFWASCFDVDFRDRRTERWGIVRLTARGTHTADIGAHGGRRLRSVPLVPSDPSFAHRLVARMLEVFTSASMPERGVDFETD
jgi:hypothetical protein